jgi:hypothetical protein
LQGHIGGFGVLIGAHRVEPFGERDLTLGVRGLNGTDGDVRTFAEMRRERGALRLRGTQRIDRVGDFPDCSSARDVGLRARTPRFGRRGFDRASCRAVKPCIRILRACVTRTVRSGTC